MSREIKPATPQQVKYLQSLEMQLYGYANRHEHIPLWRAAKRITKLKDRLDDKTRQLKIDV